MNAKSSNIFTLLPALCHEQDAPWNAADAARSQHTLCDTSANGLDPLPRHSELADSSAIATLILAAILLLAFSARGIQRLISSLPQDLWGIRDHRRNFDNHTAGELRAQLLVIATGAFCTALILTASFATHYTGTPTAHTPFVSIVALTGMAMAFYIFQLGGCRVIGYTFADRTQANSWSRGLNGAFVLFSLTIIIPALVAIFYPTTAGGMAGAAIILYIISRICFIFKGFRIFFNNLGSLLYFILYLCAFEIVPVLIIGRIIINTRV